MRRPNQCHVNRALPNHAPCRVSCRPTFALSLLAARSAAKPSSKPYLQKQPHTAGAAACKPCMLALHLVCQTHKLHKQNSIMQRVSSPQMTSQPFHQAGQLVLGLPLAQPWLSRPQSDYITPTLLCTPQGSIHPLTLPLSQHTVSYTHPQAFIPG